MEIATSPRYQSRKSPITLSLQPCEGGRRAAACGRAASALLSGWHAVSPTVWRRARVPCVMKGRARSASARWRRRDDARHLPGMEACCAITVAEDLVGDQVPQPLTNMRCHINTSAPITNFRLFLTWYRFKKKQFFVSDRRRKPLIKMQFCQLNVMPNE